MVTGKVLLLVSHEGCWLPVPTSQDMSLEGERGRLGQKPVT